MMITQIEDYFDKGCGRCARFDTDDCSARIWRPGLFALRALCRAAGLTEAVKWGHPCYVHNSRNIAIIGATRAGIRLNFFEAALMRDPEGVLQKQGPNTRHPDMITLATAEDVARLVPVIRAYLAEAIGYADAGIKPAKDTSAPELPDALVTALGDDPELAEAFAALTPGRQKSYVLMVNGAKALDTKLSRIAKARDKILAGKCALDR
jgi:uncharacterized protein YdeI (YjbR/CyaY-like superfamily)